MTNAQRDHQNMVNDMVQQAVGGVGTLPDRANMNTSKKSRYFTAVLYPDCLEHMDMLKYITSNNRYEYVYILHDKDLIHDAISNTESEKKAHYHILWKTRTAHTLQNQINYFHIWINHIEIVSSYENLIRYFLHDTPDSLHKHQYDIADLHGDSKLIKSALGNEAIIQNTNLVEMAQILKYGSGSLTEMIIKMGNVPDNECGTYLDTLSRFQGIICEMSRQESRAYQEGSKRIKSSLYKENETCTQ